MKHFSLRIAAAAALLFATNALAIDPEVLRQVTEADNVLATGDTVQAESLYTNAKGTAADKQDWDGMLTLSNRFLNIASEYHGMDCYLIANQIAYHHVELAPTDGDPDAACSEAVNELRRISMTWELDLSTIAMSADTMAAMQRMADDAFNNADIDERNNCN